jgi:hypothetical protein
MSGICLICGKKARNDIYAKIDKDLIYFCSEECAYTSMIRTFEREGKVIALRIAEG